MAEEPHMAGEARMVDVAGKQETRRRAVAAARLRMRPETADLVARAALPKGDALAVARVAGILGAKRTADLLPLCHPLPLTSVLVDFEVGEDFIEVVATVETFARTGVEMEALTAAALAALSIYDMAKGVDREMEVAWMGLVEKAGGRSGKFVRG